MTLLSRETLLDAMDPGVPIAERLVLTPLLDRKQVGPGSIDLRLGTEFLTLSRTAGAGVDAGDAHPDHAPLHNEVRLRFGDSLWLHPEQFVLGSTLEFIHLPPNFGAYVLGRSSWGRIGLLVATAVMVQPGYAGTLTLELTNEGDAPIRLYPGLRVAQLAVHTMSSATARPYTRPGAKYLAPVGPQASRAAWDKQEIRRLRRLRRTLS